MPRFGINPSRGKTLDFEPPRVTVAVLTFVPNLSGYFQHRLDVTKLTLQSILKNTEGAYELLVFDNGSCPELVAYLKDLQTQGHIDTLVLSQHNLGKLNALWRIAQLAMGEVVAYTDDDVYHMPGWLPRHLELLDGFPQVGAVTGFYIKQRVNMSSDATLKWAEALEASQPEAVQRGQFIPRKWEEEYMDNSGRSEERYQSEIAGLEDVIVSQNGIKAWVSAHHFQVLLPKKVLLEVLAEMLEDGWSDLMMGRMVEMDDRIDAKGYLRLTTYEQTMRLLGNAIDDEVAALAARDGVETSAAVRDSQPNVQAKGIWRLPKVRGLAERITNWLYQKVHGGGE